MFDRLPHSVAETGRPIGRTGALGILRGLGGGEMRFKDQSHIRLHCDTTDYIEKVNYNGHAVRNYMNKEIEERMFQQDCALTGATATFVRMNRGIYFLFISTIHISPEYSPS
jgi:hypothetical protein